MWYNKLRLGGNAELGAPGQNYEHRIMIQQHLKCRSNIGTLDYMATVDPNSFSLFK